jgi:hypothetical protein
MFIQYVTISSNFRAASPSLQMSSAPIMTIYCEEAALTQSLKHGIDNRNVPQYLIEVIMAYLRRLEMFEVHLNFE